MKKLLFLLPFGLMLSACSNDFEVTAPWKDIPVVYGILAPLDPALYPKDTAFYIRVEKAFIDPEKSALEIAQIVDSLYYPENAITVWLERTNDGARLQMKRVDGALEGYPRDAGVFAGQPNWLYKAKPTSGFSIDAGKTYRLIIERVDGRPDVTAETTVPNDFFVTIPNPSDQKIGFFGSVNTQIKWNTDVNGAFFNVTLVIRINEKIEPNGPALSTQTLIWEAAKNVELDDSNPNAYTARAFLSGTSFYNFLAQNLQRLPPGRIRQFKNFDIIIEGGGKEIKEYLETAQANSGLTGAETFPNYTNISEGYGIFTAKNRTVLEGVGLRPLTIDSMNLSSIVDTLGFVK
ncbi:MAG: DUF4249 family protein [Saprospiraceae bacterium]|nr:DUF4249 family protein [Saprospiraceae bacterium]